MLDELPGELLAGEVLLVRLLLHGGVRILSEELLLVGLLVGLRLAGGVGLLTGEVLLVGLQLAGGVGILTGEVLLVGLRLTREVLLAGDKEEMLLLAVLAELTDCSMETSSSIISRE